MRYHLITPEESRCRQPSQIGQFSRFFATKSATVAGKIHDLEGHSKRGSAAALAAFSLSFSLPAFAADPAPKYPITLGTAESMPLWTDSPEGAGGDHGTRVYCATSHFSYDDPIVFPNQPGAAHLHTFWGNTGADFASTGESLLLSGNASCEGGTNNRSSYWAPAFFNENDQAMVPFSNIVYYKSFGSPAFDRTTIRPIPNGLQMLASQKVLHSGSWLFTVEPVTENDRLMVVFRIGFPPCVAVSPTGTPILASEDNVSHLAYSSTADGNANECPNSHPYRIPQVSYNLTYDVPPDSEWYLASDASSATQGASLHADYIAAWDEDSMNALVECNIAEKRECEFGSQPAFRNQLPERFLSATTGEAMYAFHTLLSSADDRPFGAQLTKMFMPSAGTRVPLPMGPAGILAILAVGLAGVTRHKRRE